MARSCCAWENVWTRGVEEVPGVGRGRRKMHSEQLHRLQRSNIVKMIRSRIMWVSRMRDTKKSYEKRRDNSEDLDVNGRIILKLILEQLVSELWIGVTRLRTR